MKKGLLMIENKKQLSFRCKESSWKRFKMFCTFHEVSVQDKIGQLIDDFLQKRDKENAKNTTIDKTNIR
jgi:hypothetical protein